MMRSCVRENRLPALIGSLQKPLNHPPTPQLLPWGVSMMKSVTGSDGPAPLCKGRSDRPIFLQTQSSTYTVAIPCGCQGDRFHHQICDSQVGGSSTANLLTNMLQTAGWPLLSRWLDGLGWGFPLFIHFFAGWCFWELLICLRQYKYQSRLGLHPYLDDTNWLILRESHPSFHIPNLCVFQLFETVSLGLNVTPYPFSPSHFTIVSQNSVVCICASRTWI